MDEIPWEEVTVIIIQYKYPEADFMRFQQMGCAIRERLKWIFEVTGQAIGYELQVVDAIKLDGECVAFKH